MTDQPEPDRLGRNRWELALWIVSSALILVAAAVGLFSLYYLHSSVSESELDSPSRALVEVALQFSPGVMTAGLFGIVLAIAIRAIGGVLLRRSTPVAATMAPATTPPLTPTPSASVDEIVQPLPRGSSSSAPVDHSLYMRPTDDGVAQRE